MQRSIESLTLAQTPCWNNFKKKLWESFTPVQTPYWNNLKARARIMTLFVESSLTIGVLHMILKLSIASRQGRLYKQGPSYLYIP